jgi:hypothetical protein
MYNLQGFLVPNLFMSLAFGAASAYMARARGKNPFLWFFLGMLFGIFGLLFIMFSKPQALGPKKAAEPDPMTIDVTPKLDPIHENKCWYYLDPQNQQFGPMSFDGLKRAWKEGKVEDKTYVWNENLDDWLPFGDFIKENTTSNV